MTRPQPIHPAEPQPCVEHLFGNILHREFPLHVAKIRAWKRRYGSGVVR